MKKTATLIKQGRDIGNGNHEWLPVRKITCEVTGEMDTGEKVWTDLETGEQYFCCRMLGHWMFYKE